MRHFLRLLGDGYSSSFYFSPATDNEGGGGDQPSLAAQLSEAAAGVQDDGTATEPSPAGEQPAQAATAQQTQQPATPANQTSTTTSATPVTVPAWREVATELGYNLPDNVDEKTVLRQLWQGYAQGRQATQSLQSVMPHWNEFLEWQKTRQQQPAAPAAAPAAKPSWKDKYKPVEYDASWRSMIEEDPLTGELRPKAGAPADVIARLRSYENARNNIASTITDPTNPFGWLEDPVKELAAQMAEETYKRLRAQEREEEFAHRTIQSPEMAWLYQRDDKGNVQADMHGNPLLSDLGRVYRDAAAKLHQSGLSNEMQHEFALAKAREAWAIQQAQNPQPANQQPSKPAPSNRERKNERMHAQHERAPNLAAALPGPAESFSPPPTNTEALSLRDRLAITLKDATDQDILDFAQGRPAMAS